MEPRLIDQMIFIVKAIPSKEELAKELNRLELDLFKRIIGLGMATDGEKNANFYEFENDISSKHLQRLEVRDDAPVPGPDGTSPDWGAYISQFIFDFELIEWCKVVLGDKIKWVVLLRKLEVPIKRQADGTLTTNVPGWEWLVPKIVGEDLHVSAAECTWFGGPNDRQDNGMTSSGAVNTRAQPDFQGCALPMSGFKNSQNTKGSPLPRFRWLTAVEVRCIDEDLKDRKLSVELIDLGPARQTKHAIDLTESAFNALGAASSRGVVKVDFVIRNWRQHLDPKAIFTEIPASSSANKPLNADNEKVRVDPVLEGWNAGAFAEFIKSLQLTSISAAELIPYFARQKNGVSNQPPDPDLWPNFAPTLLVLDKLRQTLGAKVHVTSSYRHPAYNRQLGGAASLSQHMAFRAADIQFDGKTPREVHRALSALRGTSFKIPSGARFAAGAMINNTRGVGSDTPFRVGGLQIQNPTPTNPGSFTFEGGLGLYETFVHLDCRGIRQDW